MAESLAPCAYGNIRSTNRQKKKKRKREKERGPGPHPHPHHHTTTAEVVTNQQKKQGRGSDLSTLRLSRFEPAKATSWAPSASLYLVSTRPACGQHTVSTLRQLRRYSAPLYLVSLFEVITSRSAIHRRRPLRFWVLVCTCDTSRMWALGTCSWQPHGPYVCTRQHAEIKKTT